MTQIVILPHEEYCPEGSVIEVQAGTSICEALLENDIPIEHACELSCACTTCHVIVREGFKSLNPSDENEDDLLSRSKKPQTEFFFMFQDLLVRMKLNNRNFNI